MLGFFFDGLSCLLMSFHLLWASRPRKKNNSSTACAAWPKVKFLSPGLKAKNALFWAVLAAVSWWVSQVRRMESSRIPLKIFVQGMDSLCKFLAQHRMPPKIPRVKKTNAKAFWTNGLWWANYQTASNGLKFERCWGVWLLNKTFMPETWVVCVFFLQENMHVYSNNHVHPSPQHIGFLGVWPFLGRSKKVCKVDFLDVIWFWPQSLQYSRCILGWGGGGKLWGHPFSI